MDDMYLIAIRKEAVDVLLDQEADGPQEQLAVYVERLVREVRKLRFQNRDLREAAQKPRPMSEAPPVDREVWAVVPVLFQVQDEEPYQSAYFHEDGGRFDEQSALGWLPLPGVPE